MCRYWWNHRRAGSSTFISKLNSFDMSKQHEESVVLPRSLHVQCPLFPVDVDHNAYYPRQQKMNGTVLPQTDVFSYDYPVEE
jgi:hypothetical protein